MLTLSFGVACIAGLTLLAARGRGALTRLRQPAGAWALGFCGLFFYHALYFTALRLAPPAQASLVNYLWPLLIVLFSAGAGLRARHLAGAALGLAGTALLVGVASGDAAPAPLAGYVAAFGCALVWSGYSVLNRRFAGASSEMMAGVCGLVAVAAAPLHLLLEPTVVPAGMQWAFIVLMGLGPTGLAFFLWDHATKHGNVPLLGSLSYVAPLLSTALLIAAGLAPASPRLVGAAVLIIAGAAVAAVTGRAPRPAA